jgi:hypothetical protein
VRGGHVHDEVVGVDGYADVGGAVAIEIHVIGEARG